MILTQEQAFLKAEKQLQELMASVRQSADQGERIDQVERSVMEQLLHMGLSLLTAFVARHGDGDAGETAVMPDGETVRRLDEPHERR
jgi:hypothetical protein